MKKILVGASAIAMVAAASSANAAEKIEIGISGTWAGGYLFGQQDSDTDNGTAPGAGVRSSNFVQISEFHFGGSTELDNGIEVGVKIEVEGETNSDQIDDSYVYFDGGFGNLAIGGRSGAASVFAKGAVSVVPGGGVNDPDFIGVSDTSGGIGADMNDFEVEDNMTGDTPGIRYTTPSFAGFYAAFSAHTDAGEGDRVTGLTTSDNTGGSDGEIYGAGVGYKGSFGDVKLSVGVAYEKNMQNNSSTSATWNDEEDLVTGHVQVDFGNFRVQGGASLQTQERESNATGGLALGTWDEEEKFDAQIGVRYKMDDISFSVEYAYLEYTFDNLNANLEDTAEGNLFGGGVAYDMGAGITVGAGLYGFDIEDKVGVAAGAANDSNENSGWYGMVTTQVKF